MGLVVRRLVHLYGELTSWACEYCRVSTSAFRDSGVGIKVVKSQTKHAFVLRKQPDVPLLVRLMLYVGAELQIPRLCLESSLKEV